MANEKDQKDKKETEKEDKSKKDEKEDKKEELSEEDQAIKDKVDELVGKIQDPEVGVAKLALATLRTELKTSTGTVTAVPKPLRFLRPHYDLLKEHYDTKLKEPAFANILSLLAMTVNKDESTASLEFRLAAGIEEFDEWGHEYVRHVSGELMVLYGQRLKESKPVDDLMKLVDLIVPFDFKHNSEPQACDLLLEVDRLKDCIPHCTEDNQSRVCNYLLGIATLCSSVRKQAIHQVVYDIKMKLNLYTQALQIALLIQDRKLTQTTFDATEDELVKKQMAFQLARQHIFLDYTGDDAIDEIVSNMKISKYFLYTARDFNVMDPKTPEDIYKTHLHDQRTNLAQNISSHTQNLAATFVNAFANCGFLTDKLMTTEKGNEWLYKNKDHRQMTAAASLGLIMLWEVEEGIPKVDKFLYSNDDYVKAGALMAIGILHCGVRNEFDPALAMMREYLEEDKKHNRDVRLAAIMGLGLAYCGTRREEVYEELINYIDVKTPLEVCVFAALSLSLVFVGACNDVVKDEDDEVTKTVLSNHENIVQHITTTLSEIKEDQIKEPLLRFLYVALGVLHLGCPSKAELLLDVLGATLNEKIAKSACLTVKTCAYAGSGDTTVVREMMKECVEKIEKEEDAFHQSIAVMGIGLVAMGEELGGDMCKRLFEHLLQYGDVVMRRAIPLALALVSMSNPQLIVTDTLGKLSHDADQETSMAACLALGLVGAGTSNARISNMLRQLASFYAKEANHLFLVRVSQGLLFMGKGLLTLNPFMSDRRILNFSAVAGLLLVMHASLDLKGLIFGKHHFLLYYLVTAISPRMLLTVNPELEPVGVTVRVGAAVDTVAVAGRPKTITGFQTHNTPVLLSYGDRAELGTDKFGAITDVLEDVIIVEAKKEGEE
eukprot:TRINITY_DN13838_c0_g1_i1.p1 TRINITY_DN13838_c0_g1~~TRINITY_DN13838_c0_g1_i1.p1  ORF type:complete len:889 (-),score=131.33 TRINITY_DN13838_c0_g1_i1:230-2896(-)